MQTAQTVVNRPSPGVGKRSGPLYPLKSPDIELYTDVYYYSKVTATDGTHQNKVVNARCGHIDNDRN